MVSNVYPRIEKGTNLQPKGCAFPHSRQLCRLEMGESQGGEITVLLSKGRESVDHNCEFFKYEIASLAQEDEICVVGHVARRSSQVNNCGGCRRDESESVDVGHNIVAAFLFFLCGDLVLGIVEVLGGRISEKGVGIDCAPTRLAFICAIASSEIGNPSSFSAMARLSQRSRQVRKRSWLEKRWLISLDAYLLDNGLW